MHLFRKRQPLPGQCVRLLEFSRELAEVLSRDAFIARSDYKALVGEYEDLYGFFSALATSEMLEAYCAKNGLQHAAALKFLADYEDIRDLQAGSSLISSHNADFISRHLVSDKAWLDGVLRPVDRTISLDEEQRKVVLSDEDYTLVVAGAGAGKTTTVAAKVRYLVEVKGVDPSQILVISFTNKAVGELKAKINKSLGIPCPVTTFHKTGFAILRKQDMDKKNVVDSGFLYDVVNNYLKSDVLHYPEMIDKLVMFFGSYFDAPYEGDDLNAFFNYVSKADFTSMRSNMNEYAETITDNRRRKAITINYESLRSSEEVTIANFLYLNGVDYEYEKQYPFSFRHAHRAYTPDFTITQDGRTIYLEHFGVTESGANSRYTARELERYKKEVNDKILFHRSHGTQLIYTFSSYNDGKDMLVHLEEELVRAGICLERRPAREVYEKIVSTEENKYILKLVRLICSFIVNFKTNGYSESEFDRMHRQTGNVRTKLFLDVCRQCYLEYAKKLSEKGAVDFEDMINDSARILRDQRDAGSKLDFKYVIIDEYQDISRQRFDLAKALSAVCDAKIIAVGDDWQSIFAYAGSDITLFTHFAEIMGYGEELKITRTYRNSQEIIDIAGNFIQRNSAQIRKSLISPKHIDRPIVVETYSESVDRGAGECKGGKFFLQAQAVERAIAQILSDAGRGRSSILLIGRYGFDAFNLSRSGLFTYDEHSGKVRSVNFPDADLTFLTAHRSKGLGYDNVIIINAMEGVYGFPSKIVDDPVMSLVVREDRSYDHAEERRLFYVALTRTKNRVYLIAPQQRPSRFVLELVRDYPNVVVDGELDADNAPSPELSAIKRCPICGYPLLYRHRKTFGLKLWICTNEPELCDFMTNDTAGGILPILKCDKCKDGYLIVKKAGDHPFLGCTNFKHDGTGCDRRMSLSYYERFRDDEDFARMMDEGK